MKNSWKGIVAFFSIAVMAVSVSAQVDLQPTGKPIVLLDDYARIEWRNPPGEELDYKLFAVRSSDSTGLVQELQNSEPRYQGYGTKVGVSIPGEGQWVAIKLTAVTDTGRLVVDTLAFARTLTLGWNPSSVKVVQQRTEDGRYLATVKWGSAAVNESPSMEIVWEVFLNNKNATPCGGDYFLHAREITYGATYLNCVGKDQGRPFEVGQTHTVRVRPAVRINDGWYIGHKSPEVTFTIGDGITSVDSEPTLPETFSLQQNYPNPFNPGTTINYSLEKTGPVSIDLYNALGQKVRSLLNELRPAGKNSVYVNASDLSSGVYYYTLQSGEFRQTKKMTLMK